MKVGVTGGAGFIGSHVVDRLLKVGHEVVIFDHLLTHKASPRPGVEVMQGDAKNATDVSELGAHVDGIIHLASVLGTQETIEDPIPAAMTNLEAGLNVLMTARKYSLPVVNIAVGNWWMQNTYSLSKSLVEQYVEMFRNEHGLRACNVRCMNAYGPNQSVAPPFGAAKVRKITPSFVCRALSGWPLQVYGDGQQISDMVYVGDVARVLVEALEYCARDQVPQYCIEIGPLTSSTVREVAELVARVAEDLGAPAGELEFLEMRPGEQTARQLSWSGALTIEQAMVNFGAHPYLARKAMRPFTNVVSADTRTLEQVGIDPMSLTPLDVGIRETVQWYVEQEGVAWHRSLNFAEAAE